jgi:hypothetical protein
VQQLISSTVVVQQLISFILIIYLLSTGTSFVNTTCPSVSNPSLAAAAKNNAWVMLPYCPGKNFAHYLKKKERTLPLSAHEQKTRFVFLY